MRSISIGIALIACVTIGGGLVRAESLVYEFVDVDGGNVVLATLDFEQLPGDHSDVVSLSFTDVGNELFGLGLRYEGVFDRMGQDTVGFSDDTLGGLIGTNFFMSNNSDMHDDNPPPTSLSDAIATNRLTLHARSIIDFPSDEIELSYTSSTGVERVVSRRGLWLAVPEPHTGLLLLIAMFWGGLIRPRSAKVTS